MKLQFKIAILVVIMAIIGVMIYLFPIESIMLLLLGFGLFVLGTLIFGLEREESTKHFPHSRFIVIFKIPPHELDRREDIRMTIQKHTIQPFDAILFQDELEKALKMFEDWGVPKD